MQKFQNLLLVFPRVDVIQKLFSSFTRQLDVEKVRIMRRSKVHGRHIHFPLSHVSFEDDVATTAW